MIRYWAAPASLVVLLLVSVGCASNKDQVAVSSHYDPLAAFPTHARYVWDVRRNSLPEDPRLRTKSNDQLLRSTVDQEFMKRGYRPVDTGPYEYKLSYQFAAYNFFSAEVSRTTGTISLELVEAESGRRVWTGYAEAQLFVGSTQEQSRKRLGEGIARMLANFPPTQRPPK